MPGLSSITRTDFILFSYYGDGKLYFGSFVQFADYFHLSAQQIYITLHDMQAHAGTLDVDRILRAEEAGEKMLLVFLRNSYSRVYHTYGRAAFPHSCQHPDHLPFIRKLDGICEQVYHDIFHQV